MRDRHRRAPAEPAADLIGSCDLQSNEIAAETAGQLTVAKLDVDANPETARNFQVVSIPTLILFKDGQPVKRIVGAKGKAALLRELSDAVPDVG